jgi:hypothetical protein
MMSDAELDELAADIKSNGLASQIVLWEDGEGEVWLLDGRNRLEACERAGVGQDFRDEDGSLDARAFRVVADDPVPFVISANVRRRHLTTAQKRDTIAKLLKLAPERSDRQIAKDVGADHKTVGAVRSKSETSGEIPHSRERVGADGRTTKATKPRPKSKAKPQPRPKPKSSPALSVVPSTEAKSDTNCDHRWVCKICGVRRDAEADSRQGRPGE